MSTLFLTNENDGKTLSFDMKLHFVCFNNGLITISDKVNSKVIFMSNGLTNLSVHRQNIYYVGIFIANNIDLFISLPSKSW